MSLWIGRRMDGKYELLDRKGDWNTPYGSSFLSKNKFSLSHSLKKGECVKIKGKIKIELTEDK